MTQPKFHLAGETVFHHRFTLEATSFLAPRPNLRNLYGYLYGLALQLSGQQAHAEVLGFERRLGLLTDLRGDRSDSSTRAFWVRGPLSSSPL